MTISPEAQLDESLAAFEDGVAALARDTLSFVRKLAPGAYELLYDAYSALSIGFGSGEKLGDCFLHVAIYPKHVNVGFNEGASLDDPDGVLQGTGSRIRHITIKKAEDLDAKPLARLIRAAMKHAGYRKPKDGRLVIKKIYPTKRPRRPAR